MTVLVVTPSDPLARDEAFCNWLKEQGIEPVNTYCLEIRDNKATVFQYDIDEDGEKYIVCGKCGEPVSGTLHSDVCNGQSGVAVKEPFEILLKGPVPLKEVEGEWA